MHVIVIGNPFDGLTLYGPFETDEDALRAAEQMPFRVAWQIVQVFNPKDNALFGSDAA